MDMSETLMIALIPSILSLVGVILTVRAGNIKIMNEMKIQQAVQDEKIAELTREVRMHNEFAIRIPVLEEKIRQFEAKNCVNP